MKVLHIGKFYSPIEGGIESINRFVVESLRKYQQRILSFNDENRSSEEDIDGIPVVRASTKGVFASQPISMKYYWELRRNIRLFNPDVVHFHYPNPLGALYLNMLIGKKRKLVVHWHSDVVAQKFLHRFISPIEHRLLKRADVIIATSPNYAESSEALQRYKDKVAIIPCSINENKFQLRDGDESKITALKSKYGNKPILLFVGRHVEYKGLEYLLEAEKYIKHECVLLIGGQGPQTSLLKNRFHSSRIHWLGRLNDEELSIYYHAATIFTFPSITKNEAFGVALAEAMYCSTPPVTYTIDGSGVNWVSVNDITGLEVENRNIKAYASAIDTLLEDKNLLNRLAANSQKRVRDMFTGHIVSEQYKRLYQSLETQTHVIAR